VRLFGSVRPNQRRDSLAQPIKRSAFLIAMAVTVVASAMSLALTYFETRRDIEEENHFMAAMTGEVLGTALNSRLEYLAELSSSPLVSSALTDSAGMSAYLGPFLKSRERRLSTPVKLFDYAGRPILGELPGLVPASVLAELVAQVLAQGRPGTAMGEGPVLLAAYPVPAPYASATAAVVVGAIPVGALLREQEQRLPSGVELDLLHRGQLAYSSAASQHGRHFPAEYALPVKASGELPTAVVRIYRADNPLLRPFSNRALFIAVVAGLFILLSWRAAAQAASRITERLRRLAGACHDIPQARAGAIPDDPSADEIGVLSRALRDALQSYQHLTEDLERRVKEKTAALSEQQELLRSSVEAVNEAFVVFDPKDRIVYCNDRYVQTYHLVADLVRPGAQFGDLVRAWKRAVSPGATEAEIEEWTAKECARRRAGGVSVTEIEPGVWVRNVDRRTPTGHMVSFRVDISELVEAMQLAEAASQSKSRFLATMSHEIRTPLNGVLGMAQLLLAPSLHDHERIEYARAVLDSGNGLMMVLNDVLDLSKIEAGRMELKPGPAAPATLIRAVLLLFDAVARAKHVGLDGHWRGPADVQYELDALRTRQILGNLVGNALKFTDSGNVSIEGNEVSRVGNLAVLEFAVTDSGVGISREQQALLFEPFVQGDSSPTRQFHGTGLGLSIVRQLARAMDGDAYVESRPGVGSRFWVRIRVPVATGRESVSATRSPPATVAPQATTPSLPDALRLPAPPPAQPAPAPAGSLAAAVPATAPDARILVVEDNAINRQVLTGMLGILGIKPGFAMNGLEAVDAATGDLRPDLVLMDCEMPVLSGYEATKQIRDWEKARGALPVPIVAVTADAFAETHERCLAAGMDDVLTKPLSLAELMAMLTRRIGVPFTVPDKTATPTVAGHFAVKSGS